jgi:hypothetical protein
VLALVILFAVYAFMDAVLPAGGNTYGGTTMPEPNPSEESSEDPRTQPEPQDQTRHAAGTGTRRAGTVTSTV